MLVPVFEYECKWLIALSPLPIAIRTLPENILFTHTGLKLPSTGGKSSDMGSDTAPAAAAAGGVLLRGATGQSTVLGRKGAGVAPAI